MQSPVLPELFSRRWYMGLLLGVSFIVLTVLFLDQPMAVWFGAPAQEGFALKARAITDIGLGENWYALGLTVFILTQWVLPRKKNLSDLQKDRIANLKNWSLHLLSALTFAGILLQLAKFIVGRQRPYVDVVNHSALEFMPFTSDWHWHSFPSGHAQVLFCLGTLAAQLKPKWRVWIYFAVLLLALTRVFIIQHFLSDVIGGAIIGIVGAQLSMQFLGRKVPRPEAM